MKKGLLIISCLLAVTVFICGMMNFDFTADSHVNTITVNADYKLYADENSLIEDADTIIVGKVIATSNEVFTIVPKEKTMDKEPVNCVYTVSDIEVIKTIKGNCNIGDIVKVKQIGGEYNGKRFIEESTEYLSINTKGVFFLQTYDSGVPASTLNPIQGHIKLKDNKAQFNKENKLFNQNIDESTLIIDIEQKSKEK